MIQDTNAKYISAECSACRMQIIEMRCIKKELKLLKIQSN